MWLDSRKRPLIFAFWLVAYGTFDCSRIVDENWRKKVLAKHVQKFRRVKGKKRKDGKAARER